MLSWLFGTTPSQQMTVQTMNFAPLERIPDVVINGMQH